jgi:probable rRNA maturation factor
VTFRIAISDQQQVLRIDRPAMRSVVRNVLRLERVPAAEVSLAFVDDAAIHSLNRRHLKHDYPTDVLSFLLAGSAPGGNSPALLEGEVIVSTEMALRRAAEFGWSPHDELTLYVVHGVLHLCGYDDVTAGARRRMRARERKALESLGLEPASPIRNRRRR